MKLPSILFLCLAAFRALAQVPPVERPPQQSLTFFVFSGPDDPEKIRPPIEFHFLDEQGTNGVSMIVGGVAGPFFRDISPSLDLYDLVPAPVDPAKPRLPGAPPPKILRPLLRVNVPKDWRNVLLMVNADENGIVRSVLPLDQSLPNLPKGHLALVSFLDQPLQVALGDQKGEVPAKGRLLLPAKPGTGARADMVMFVGALRQANGDLAVVASRKLSVNPTFRRLALLLPEPGGTVNVVMMSPASDDPVDPPPLP
jgi:hypothetical protein